MDKGISLCIPYSYHTSLGKTRKNLYRVADYNNGRFDLINLQTLSDYTEDFNPKYLRYHPVEDNEFYTPIVRKWNSIINSYDAYKSLSESFPCDNINFFEVIINPQYMSADNEQIITLLKTGIELPEGVADNILIATDQDTSSYRTVLCPKKYFKINQGRYYLDNKLEDILHTIHSLDVYYIKKNDVFNTSDFGYFYLENGLKAPVRSFYAYDKLPEKDGKLFLHHFEEYLPIYISKYLKTHVKDTGLNKSNIQAIVNAVKDALASHTDLDTFFSITGYQSSTYEERLPDYEERIIKYLDGTTFLDNVLTKILISSDELADKYTKIAKAQWMKQIDEDRNSAEENLKQIEKCKQKAEEQRIDVEKKCSLLEAQYQQLQVQYSSVTTSIDSTLKNFDAKIGEHIANSTLYRLISSQYTQNGFQGNPPLSNIIVKYPTDNYKPERYVAKDITKARKILEHNLKVAGIDAPYSAILSNLFGTTKSDIHSLIVSGFFARKIADAFAYSIDGTEATRITVTSPSINYNEIFNTITSVSEKVILLENLLDTYNELIFTNINKDFPDKIFIISIDQEENLSMLSKNIWTYGLLLNTDVAVSPNLLSQDFRIAIVHSDLELKEVSSDTSDYQELKNTLAKFGFPAAAKTNFARIIAYLYNDCTLTSTSEYIGSVLAKYCMVYEKDLNFDDLTQITNQIPTKIKNLYFFE